MKKIWKTVIFAVLIIVVLGGVLIGVALITGADTGRVQDLFNSAYDFAGIKAHYAGIIQNLLGIQPMA